MKTKQKAEQPVYPQWLAALPVHVNISATSKGGEDMIDVSVEDVADPVLKDIVLNKEPRLDKKQRKDKRYQEMIKLADKIRSRLNTIKTFEHFKMLETYRSWYPHPLDDNRKDYWSVRLKKDNPYRLIFQYDEEANALRLIDFLDYHKDRRNRR